MPALALDVGSYSIKVLSGKTGSKFVVDKALEILNTVGYAVPPDEAKTNQLQQLLSAMATDYSLPRNDVRISLPESMVATKVIAIPPLSDAELASAIQWQAERHIPISPEDLSLEYQVISRPKKGQDLPMKVLMVGVRKSNLENYLNIYVNAGLEPTLVETHNLSILRSVNLTASDPSTMVVHLGAAEMLISVSTGSELNFVITHSSGTGLLSKAVMETVGLTTDQAEQYVRAYGLDEQQFEGKVRAILLPLVQDWISVMRRSIQFYTNENPGQNLQRVILSGGGAVLNGLVPMITQELGTEVLLVAPFATASGKIPDVSHTAYTVCAGLLSREV